MPDHDVMSILDDQWRPSNLAAAMRQRDPPARGRLPGNGYVGIADSGRTSGEPDQACDSEYADAGALCLDTGTQTPGTRIRQRRDGNNFASPPARAHCAEALSSPKGKARRRRCNLFCVAVVDLLRKTASRARA